MDAEPRYQAQTIVINNYRRAENNYLSFAVTGAKYSQNSEMLLDQDMGVLYLNDRMGTFARAARGELSTFLGAMRFARMRFTNIDEVIQSVTRTYKDLKERELAVHHNSGTIYHLLIIPVCTGLVFDGCILSMRNQDAENKQLYTWGQPWAYPQRTSESGSSPKSEQLQKTKDLQSRHTTG